jgi:hypothetical protein
VPSTHILRVFQHLHHFHFHFPLNHYHSSTISNISTATMAFSTKLSAVMLLLITIFSVLSLGAAIPVTTDLVST